MRCTVAWILLGSLVLTFSSEGGEKPKVVLEYTSQGRIEPGNEPGLGFQSSTTGAATFSPGDSPFLCTSDSSPSADGKFYFLSPGTLADAETDVRIEVTVRVPRSVGHPSATALQVPVDSGRATLGPLRLGGMGEAYQDFVAQQRWVGLGFTTHATDPSQDEATLLDLGGAAGGRVLGRLQLPLNVMRTYVLEIHRGTAGSDDDWLRLSAAGVPPVSARLDKLSPRQTPSGFGLIFGHPSGAGLGEAQWQRVAIHADRPLPLSPEATAAGAVVAEPLPVGPHRCLAMDSALFEKIEGVRLAPGKFEKCGGNPVLRREHPWETNRCELYGSCVWDSRSQRLQLFYSAASAVCYDHKLAYAESCDGGLTWRKPMLEIYKHQGQATNIVWPGRYWVAGPTVFLDPHDPDPARQYKLLTTDSDCLTKTKPDRGPSGIDVGWSPDGIHWTSAAKNPVIRGFNSDTGPCAFWDQRKQRYVAYVRMRSATGRSVGIVESPDFETWTEPRLIFAPSGRDREEHREFYGLSVTPYQGAYVGLLWIFPAMPASADPKADSPATWLELVFSRDGENWQRIARGEPILPLGSKGSFDGRQTRPASSLVVLDDRILLLYAGSPDPHISWHKFDIGLATLRPDGFAAMTAAGQEGVMLSRPLTFGAGRLRVNAKVSADGYVKAALLDAGQNVLPGFEPERCRPLTGDDLRAELTWEGNRGLPPSPPEGLRIRFLLKNAELFSFSVEPRDE